jgi:hypothetical protein
MSDNKDWMRTHLVTKFICADCGTNLHLSYDRPKGNSRCVQGEPTGAAMVESLISIHPCQNCMAPLEKIKSAVKTLSEI